jgi:hypothetical protein
MAPDPIAPSMADRNLGRERMSKVRKLTGVIALLLAVGLAHGATSDQNPWDSSIDAATKARFIPVELWTGGDWDGSKDLKMSKAEKRFGDRSNKDIKGPTEWKHPVTGETLIVYERTNEQRDGVKSQLFAMNEEKTGLGRVYDLRDEVGTRTFSGGLKFPLGYWKQGETKQVVEKRYEGSRVDTRIESITITKLDFTYRGVSHCLEFEWIYKDSRRSKIIDHQTYTYCPNQGMVGQVKH